MIDDPMNRLKVKRGSDLPQAKLDEAQVKQIRSLIETREGVKATLRTMTNEQIARRYGVHPRTIDKISQGIT